MNGQAIINLVDDEEMSSQGSVNAPVVTPRPGSPSQVPMTQAYDTPSGIPQWLGMHGAMPMQTLAPTMQSNVFARPSGVAHATPVMGGSGPNTIPPIIPIDAPSHQEIKEAFSEVSSTFQEMSTK